MNIKMWETIFFEKKQKKKLLMFCQSKKKL